MAYTFNTALRSAIMRRLEYVPSHPYDLKYQEALVILYFRDLANPPQWETLARYTSFCPDFRYAIPLPSHLFHTLPTVQIKLKPKDVMADLTGRADLQLVGERFRDLIETEAPGAAQFIPATLIDAANETITRFGRRYFMNILDFVTPFDLFAGTNVIPEIEDEHHARVFRYQPANIARRAERELGHTLSAAAVKGHLLFRCVKVDRIIDGVRELHSSPEEIYISDQFAQIIKKSRLTNIVMYHCNEV
jgi:hypothetical protein